LFQLERTLGIRMERMPVDGNLPEYKEPVRSGYDALQSPLLSTLVPLPGEVLQGRMAAD
jgi:hypothetical protein